MARILIWSMMAAFVAWTAPRQAMAQTTQSFGGAGYQGGFYGGFQPGVEPGVLRGYWGVPNDRYGYANPVGGAMSNSRSPRALSDYFDVVPSRAGKYVSDTTDKKAYITVLVPDPNAEVTVGGQNTGTSGRERHFQSPELPPGTYSYNVKATWQAGGRPMTKEFTVKVKPGAWSLVDFMPAER